MSDHPLRDISQPVNITECIHWINANPAEWQQINAKHTAIELWVEVAKRVRGINSSYQ